ncbi:mechanosensitive ion channel family protein [Mucisphaera calidilacus]|uniref:Small-conductance mechanosensitive channel n=1 Tax=Mucisphaera calidilacus TaxID=2527982 RepID=A0A518BXX4_9BACT|nr:mechanosensitive ion channel domain-containing protein [Mucisphaera calidilacus]QDU71808.1 Small-conductance mechanosensitive channel [Mucisphaera calidilacus]
MHHYNLIAQAAEEPQPTDEPFNISPEMIQQLALDYAPKILGALAIIIITLLVAGIVAGVVRSTMRRANTDETLTRFIGKMIWWGLLLLGALTSLTVLGVQITAFAAVLAAMGFAIGLAFQGTLGNLASGVMLLVFRPFKVGDVVNVSGTTGKVFEIDLFTTLLDTPDNRRIIVPNGTIFGSTIENITHHPTRRCDVSVGTEYPADLDKVRETLEKAVASVDGVLTDPAHQIYLLELGDSSINWAVRVWVNTPDFWAVREKLTRAVKVELDNAGIGIPYPQMDVHLFKQDTP